MAQIPYTKPFLPYKKQLEQLRERGLTIGDEHKALHLLENISYYRLSGYWYPLLDDKEAHLFKQGANFDVAFGLYCFDKDLRKLVFSEIEKVEVAIRSQMIHVLAESFGAFWLEDRTLFTSASQHEDVLRVVTKEYARCDEKFIEAFRSKYADPLPPCWMLLEVTSLGTLSMIYKYLKPGRSKRAIASKFALNDDTFESWLHSIVYVRNICAHHGRLWNRVFSIRPLKLHNPERQWLKTGSVNNARLFYFASALMYLLKVINPNNRFKHKFLDLLRSNQNLNYNHMGFCDDWQSEPLWSE